MAAPSSTYNAAGNADASASLAASASRSFNLDLRTKFAGKLTVKVASGGAVAATAGLRIDVFHRYGSTPTDTNSNPTWSGTIPITAISTTYYSPCIELPTGWWRVTITNLDATNAVTPEATLDTVDAVA